jgi:hypothetical protein
MLHHRTNTGSAVWADAYRSRKNETFLARNGFASHVHRKKPVGRPMPTPIRRANGRKSAVRAHIEHIFAEQKDRMDLFSRTIGIARARIKIGLANLGAAEIKAGAEEGERTCQSGAPRRAPHS